MDTSHYTTKINTFRKELNRVYTSLSPEKVLVFFLLIITSIILFFAAFVFFTLGLVFVSVFLLIATKIKRVAVGKKKLAIIDSYRTECYEWPDIKSIQFVPYFNLYRMKVRGRKGKIYFLPNQSSEAIYGLFPSGGFIDQKQNK